MTCWEEEKHQWHREEKYRGGEITIINQTHVWNPQKILVNDSC